MEPSTSDQSRQSKEDAIHHAFNRYRGRLAGFVEACNLDPKQERGIISTAKSLSYDLERDTIKHLSGE